MVVEEEEDDNIFYLVELLPLEKKTKRWMESKVCSPFRLSVREKVGNLHLNWEQVEDIVKLREEERDWSQKCICTKGVWFPFGCFVLKDIF